MTNMIQGTERMLKSARALKVYFENKLKMSLELLIEAPKAHHDGDVAFNSSMHAIGLWGLRAPRPLDKDQTSEVLEMFHAILGALQSLEQQREELKTLQTHLENSYAHLPSNVIPFRRRAEPLYTSAAKRWTIRRDCLIEASSLSEIHKMAMEMHSHSQRYAFLEFRDLDAKQRQWLPDLLGLGALTLFIPDLSHLTMAEQTVLHELTVLESPNRPLVMVGTLAPFAELRTIPGVHLDFLNSVSRVYIKLTKDFQEYKEQGLIHYFLDSLSEDHPLV